MTQIKKLQAFTLIEILVVIAIIGILSGIVLVALGGVLRNRAKDSRIIIEMNQIRSAAATYYSNNNYSFAGFNCNVSQPDMSALCNDITGQGGKNLIIVAESQQYCAEVQLNSNAWWCVDSYGRSAKYDTNTTPTEPDCNNTPGSEFYACE